MKSTQYKISFDTKAIRLCVQQKEILEYLKGKYHYPFIIPSIVQEESIGLLTKFYKNRKRAKKDVEDTKKKLAISVKLTTKRDKYNGIKKYKYIKGKIKGKRIGQKDCIILTSMKRLKVTHIMADDEFFEKEAKEMGFRIIKISGL